MKLFGCTVVKNEEEMVPYVMPYIERLGYDKFVVYDDSSTDNTVEILSKYPFVEIRYMEPTHSIREFDDRKSLIQANFFSECWDYIHKNNDEDVWMTFTDFDEVIFCSGRNDFKQEIDVYDMMCHKCYLNKPLIQVVSNGYENKIYKIPPSGTLVHMNDNMRMNFWNGIFSEKVTLLKVNAFKEIVCYGGNHFMRLNLQDEYKKIKEEGQNISLNNAGIFHNFHLKWIDYSILEKKHQTTKNNENAIADLKTAYFNMIASSYPVDMYFALDTLYCALKSDEKNLTFI